MCGICGIISKKPIQETTPLYRMQKALHHRGPDGKGEFFHTHLALAMCRLSIIDLSGGWQPLYNEDRTIILIANAEIYNFVELRNQLRSRGHIFSTGSDCETVVHLYEEHGPECVHKLRGMFAFALWDTRHKILVLARDRMGEKPLYLFERDGMICFASEIKALLHSGLVPFELDPVAIDQYFHYQFVPEPRTALQNVRKLEAGHILSITIEPWKIKDTTYWDLETAPLLSGDPGEMIRNELETIGNIILRSDVPVGIALSGGLDSSVITALAARKYPDTLHAFSVGYPGHPPYDERADAKMLADYLKIPFHDVELTTEDMVAFFPKLVFWRDDPITDLSGYGYYAVMKLAREHAVPVMLQGQGGDELFWGYGSMVQAVRESLAKAWLNPKGWKALPSYLCPAAPDGLRPEQIRRWLSQWFGLRSGWQQFQRQRTGPPGQMIFYDVEPDYRMAAKEMPGLYTYEFSERLGRSRASDLFTFETPWPEIDIRLTRLICETYLRANGIVQGDRLSMASSVEMRLPLVDYRLVEIVLGLRRSQKDYCLPPKRWFRSALGDLLPDWVLNRPKKGFEPPVRQWHEALFKTYGKSLDGGYLVKAGLLRGEAGQRLSTGPFPKGAVFPVSLSALVLETWCRQMLDISTS